MGSPLVRNIVAAVGGYLVMFLTIFVAFSVVWMALGADGSFAPGTWDVSSAWVVTSIILGIVAAVVGGWTCAKLAVSHQAVAILIAIVVVLGIASAIPDAPAAAGLATG